MRRRRFEPAAPVAFAIALAGVVASSGTAARAVEPPATPRAACLVDDQVEDVLVHQGVQYLAGRFFHVRPPGTEPGAPEEVARTWFAACDAETGAVLPWNPLVDCVGGGSTCNNPRASAYDVSYG